MQVLVAQIHSSGEGEFEDAEQNQKNEKLKSTLQSSPEWFPGFINEESEQTWTGEAHRVRLGTWI